MAAGICQRGFLSSSHQSKGEYVRVGEGSVCAFVETDIVCDFIMGDGGWSQCWKIPKRSHIYLQYYLVGCNKREFLGCR